MFTGINHICVTTHDLDRAVRTWSDRYGVGPWRLYRYDRSNMSAVVDGRPADFAMRVALAQLSPTSRIELIEPLDERSPYAQSLARHAGADHIHHVRFDVADYDATVERLQQGLGLRPLMSAEFAGASGEGPRFAGRYFAAEDDVGFILEVGRAPEGFTMPEPESVYPAG